MQVKVFFFGKEQKQDKLVKLHINKDSVSLTQLARHYLYLFLKLDFIFSKL